MHISRCLQREDTRHEAADALNALTGLIDQGIYCLSRLDEVLEAVITVPSSAVATSPCLLRPRFHHALFLYRKSVQPPQVSSKNTKRLQIGLHFMQKRQVSREPVVPDYQNAFQEATIG
jgi:hypothetical protein